jgi:uncharacterized protein (TIGR02118 family)
MLRQVSFRAQFIPRRTVRKYTETDHDYTVDKGLAGGAPSTPAAYVAMCHIFCDSVDAFQAGFGPHAQEIEADIPKYTDLAPVIQISEVVVEKS